MVKNIVLWVVLRYPNPIDVDLPERMGRWQKPVSVEENVVFTTEQLLKSMKIKPIHLKQ